MTPVSIGSGSGTLAQACLVSPPCDSIACMVEFPVLITDRLRLRQLVSADAGDIQCLAGAREVAAGTFLPHPYEVGMAERWIASLEGDFEAGKAVHFAIGRATDNVLMGSIGLEIVPEHRHARLGYWLGVPYWNHGYATEAVRAVLAYGFRERNLHRIYSPHFLGNLASGRVMEKAGMKYEGRMREHYVRFGKFVNLELYGLLQEEFERP